MIDRTTFTLDDQGIDLVPRDGLFLRSDVPFFVLDSRFCADFTHHLAAGVIGHRAVHIRALKGHQGSLVAWRSGVEPQQGPLRDYRAAATTEAH